MAAIISRKERTGETLGTIAQQAVPISVGAAVAGILACLLLFCVMLASMANFDEACY